MVWKKKELYGGDGEMLNRFDSSITAAICSVGIFSMPLRDWHDFVTMSYVRDFKKMIEDIK